MTIEIKNVWKKFGDKTVLKGINLKVEEGETLVILGRSGAGKSVLLRQMLGLDTPDEGEVIINGKEISKLDDAERYQVTSEMGMLFQASALFDSLTIRENTAFYLREHGHLSEAEIEEKITQALTMVGLAGTEDLMPSDLSGGMRKRAALARLIVYRPKILLYDEPTTGLDPITAMQINELIVKIQNELNATSVVVTHDLVSTFFIADRIALNHEGEIKYITTKDEFVKIDDPIVRSFLKNSIPDGEIKK